MLQSNDLQPTKGCRNVITSNYTVPNAQTLGFNDSISIGKKVVKNATIENGIFFCLFTAEKMTIP